MREKIKEILEQIETVIVGKNDVMERILMAILAGGHVLMEDVPGVGKTTTANDVRPRAGTGDPARAVHVRHHAVRHHRLQRL